MLDQSAREAIAEELVEADRTRAVLPRLTARYPEMAVEVRAICEKYGLPYNTGPLRKQLGSTWMKIAKLSLPNWMTRDDNDIVVNIERSKAVDAA